MKLTKKKALELCRDLWKWLEMNPERNKPAWPGWKTNRGINRTSTFCPCCEYKSQECRSSKNYIDCENGCVIYKIWGYKNGNLVCIKPRSPYILWDNGNKKEKKKYARIIRIACEKELRKLKGRKNVKSKKRK